MENVMPMNAELPKSCASCAFMVKQQIAPTDLRRHMFCFRFPPGVAAISSPQGIQVNAMHPPVQANDWCHEYRSVAAGLAGNDVSA